MNASEHATQCSFRRNGHVVEERTKDGWAKVNLGTIEALQPLTLHEISRGMAPPKGVNRAKRFIRTKQGVGTPDSYNIR